MPVNRVVVVMLVAMALATVQALAADRHVYLNSTGGGSRLNDCPNPSHNSKGTSNTDELSYCAGGTSAGKIIGTIAGTVTSGTCTGDGGTVTDVENGVSADVDRDGTNEVVYGHPQACVYNMAKSDSCEIHAGVYTQPGGVLDNHAGDFSDWAGTEGDTSAACDGFNCHYSSLIAWGFGPNMGTTGYGTAGNPGYLRGAVMNGSTDTWDSDGDKKPDTEAGEPTSYPVVFSGDSDADGTLFERTSCSGAAGATTCTGDAFNALWVGCGSERSISYSWCKASSPQFTGTEHGPYIDTDANGTYDTELGHNIAARDTSYFYVKDIEFKSYNGGNVCTSGCDNGARQAQASQAHIMMPGDGSSDGHTLDHIYFHDNDYSHTPSQQIQWAIFNDSENYGCNVASTLKNSFLVQNNEVILNTDGGGEHGCEHHWHDNLFLIDVNSARDAGRNTKFGYLKQTDYVGSPTLRTRVDRFYNNEIVVSRRADSFIIFDLTFGNPNCDTGAGDGVCPSPDNFHGTIMWYGNIVRCDPANFGTPNCVTEFYANTLGGCNDTCTDARWIMFNNTLDFTNNPLTLNDTPESLVERNNAWFGQAVGVHAGPASVTLVRSNEVCSEGTFSATCTDTDSTRANWFTPGAYASGDPDTWEGIANYTADAANGVLDNAGSCDPDGDGTNGVDYDGDGDNDLCWVDIAGNDVCVGASTCPDPPDVGAVQSEDDSEDLQGCTVIVATNGSDSNDGLTLSTPKLTIDGADAITVPGSVVCLRGGTYTPSLPSPTGQYENINDSGTVGSRITYQSFPGEDAIIDGSSASPVTTQTAGQFPELIRIRGDYITFRDIEVRNSAGVGIRSYNADGTADNPFGTIIEDLETHGNYGSGVSFYQNTGGIVRRVTSYDNADCGPGDGDSQTDGGDADGMSMYDGGDHQIYDNLFYENSDDGLDLLGAEDVVAYRNVSHTNGRCSNGNGGGFKTGGLAHATGGDNLVYNNLAYDNTKHGFDTYGSGNSIFYHNVAYHNGRSGILIPCQSDSAPNIMRNNIFWGNNQASPFAFYDIERTSAGTCSPTFNVDPICSDNLFNTISSNIADACATGKVNSDPLFVDGTGPTYDFDLQGTSPAIDQGYVLSGDPDWVVWANEAQLQLDYELVTRPTGAGYDIGAFEEAAGSPSTPGSVRGAVIRGGAIR